MDPARFHLTDHVMKPAQRRGRDMTQILTGLHDVQVEVDVDLERLEHLVSISRCWLVATAEVSNSYGRFRAPMTSGASLMTSGRVHMTIMILVVDVIVLSASKSPGPRPRARCASQKVKNELRVGGQVSLPEAAGLPSQPKRLRALKPVLRQEGTGLRSTPRRRSGPGSTGSQQRLRRGSPAGSSRSP